MGAGGIIHQRSEIKGAIGPGTANHAALCAPFQGMVSQVCDKGFDTWTDVDTKFCAAMILVAVGG